MRQRSKQVLPENELAQRRRDRALEADETLRELFAKATADGGGSGIVLVAVGGYGRSELSPFSDLDVVLLHEPGLDEDHVRAVAEAIWYPLWNDNVALDHSVRDTVQMREAAATDHRAAMGMLDARAVAGDSELVTALRSEVLADWRREARTRVQEVREARLARIERSGWLAHSAVPDLKESGGGLRDSVILRALVATWLIDVPHEESESLRNSLLDVRDALHEVSGRRVERLDAELIPEVARLLDMNPEELDLHTRQLGRRIAHLCSLAWRRIDRAVAPTRKPKISATGPVVTRLAEGVGLLDGEVIVMQRADPAIDPELALRAAAVAARDGHPLSAGSAARLAATMGEMHDPWPKSSTRLMVDLLTAGPGLIPVWDELDFAGVIDRLLPEWGPVRLRGSSSPVHSFTVDRHSLETCVFASEVQRDVARPDLLAVAALLHDIGKGVDGDHSVEGEPMAVAIATRWGFDAEDAATIGRLVRWHLLLPTIATRRDIEDPSTAANVAEVVESADFLELLAALSASDAQATGSAAWTTWRRGLIEGLVSKTQAQLDDAVASPDPQAYEGWPAQVPIPEHGTTGPADFTLEVEAHKDGSLLTVVTSDRHGLMADLAGAIALAGLEVRSARTVTLGDAAASLWEVSREDVDASRLSERIRPALAGEIDLAARLELKPADDAVGSRIRILDRLSETATLLEVRAHDRRGLVWTVCHEIASSGLSIRSAHMSTYGTEVRDVFYVVDADGNRLDDATAADLRDRVEAALG
ncbi:[protein-PII] uridylyltransferase [Aeromicrobium panaciterrae]|uniref:Bifunctional uridylyltransferase/uridylyl-removing enzyme n=1 Tax=Aeromicrobium panaciterrae TaxID=363861 RepID=A0ABU1UQK2_9ACTN|nr:[protein-PII] uridylyltransferase [Aeromicrobium panaciterrae]MDR7087442.1 [protein-PII] uridylyltransferase [Aeromicrobium panaciterrae]